MDHEVLSARPRSSYHLTMISSPLPLYYLGDSHVRYLKRAAKYGLLAPHTLSGVEVGGATAVGMRNPNAKTNALGRFREWIQDKPREAAVVLHLGEVDCGFVIWYRATKYDEPVEVQMMNSLDAYFEFVDELLRLGFSKIIITAATLPTITDSDQIGEVVVKRSAITATQLERTELTLRYNAILRERAEQRGLHFIDIAPAVLNPETGVVDTRMRNPVPTDHHMNGDLAAAYWAVQLRAVLSAIQHLPEERFVWTARRDTFVKAYPGHSKRMPADMRVAVPEGTTVTGAAIQEKGEYTILRGVRIDSISYPLMSLLHTGHYSRRAETVRRAGLLRRLARRAPLLGIRS